MDFTIREKEEDIDYQCKIVLIGESAVGKTNLLLRLCKDEFRPEAIATVGVEYAKKVYTIENKKIKVSIWDTAGQERFKAISNSYYRGAKGALVVFDITKRATFELVDKWIEDFLNANEEETFITLIGNKTDLPNRAVMKEEAEEKSKKFRNVNYIETSALRRTNVDEAFLNIVTSIYY
jgi:Ras-related protein Rab-11A